MEESMLRDDSLKSSSLLRLADILSENILLHPFVALRRTCQRKQGIAALYKGLSSELLVKGITLGTETAIANYTDWPREVRPKRYLEDSWKVLALRGISVALSTPFLCSSVIATVQSVIVVRDRPAFVDCLRDGFLRLFHLRSNSSSRILPIWLLVVPTVVYHVSHSAIWHVAKHCVDFIKRNILTGTSRRPKSKRLTKRRYRQQNMSAEHSITMSDSAWQQHDDLTLKYEAADTSIDSASLLEKDSNQISTSILAGLIADVSLLPIETVLNRLYLQGTRTIIDNCDETTVVLPVITNYDGFNDCYQSILKFEGNFGLYRGLGAIILQYSVHFLIFRSLYYLLREFQSSSTSDSSRQAPPSSSERPTAKPSLSQEEFVNYLESNRHSTPKNLTEFNRFNESRYRIDETTSSLERL